MVQEVIIIPIGDLRKTNEISEVAHRKQQPAFTTKNGYSDLVVMSSEPYDKLARENSLDQAVYESEKEMSEDGKLMDLDEAFERLKKKYHG